MSMIIRPYMYMHIIKDITVYGKKENLDIIRKNMEE